MKYECENISGPRCISRTCQYADVSVSLDLKPYATVGEIITKCIGEPIIRYSENKGCDDKCSCEVTVTQTICMKIPIEYGATADIDNSCVKCKNKDACRHCDKGC